MNHISQISPLWSTMPLTKVEEKENVTPGAAFADIFGSAVEAVRQSDEEKRLSLIHI